MTPWPYLVLCAAIEPALKVNLWINRKHSDAWCIDFSTDISLCGIQIRDVAALPVQNANAKGSAARLIVSNLHFNVHIYKCVQAAKQHITNINGGNLFCLISTWLATRSCTLHVEWCQYIVMDLIWHGCVVPCVHLSTPYAPKNDADDKLKRNRKQ